MTGLAGLPLYLDLGKTAKINNLITRYFGQFLNKAEFYKMEEPQDAARAIGEEALALGFDIQAESQIGHRKFLPTRTDSVLVELSPISKMVIKSTIHS